ncbi:MAG: hypothetical protein ABIR70_14640 [Bryobacteraceae bacterium]
MAGDKKVANSLVALSCAAVLAVYSAGYAKTRAAASQFEAQSAERRPAPPVQVAEAIVPENAPAVVAQVVEAPVAARNVVEQQVPVAAAESPLNVSAQLVAPQVVAEAPAPVPVVAPPTAPAAIVVSPAPPPPPPPAPKWKDGTYTGWGTSRHGDIQAAVVIEGGRIHGATIAQCNTRYSCDVIDMLPPQVAVRQSADVDYVSRATESANAFYYAVVDALSKATHNQ